MGNDAEYSAYRCPTAGYGNGVWNTTIGETSREEQADMMERGILLAEGARVFVGNHQNGDDPTNFRATSGC